MTRIVFMGTPEFAVPSLAALMQGEYNVVGVLTQQDRPAGRGRRVSASPVKQLALSAGLTTQQPRSLRTADAQADLARLAPDLIVVAAYGLILPQAVLDIPGHGCLNVHGSLLPRHRGAAPIAAAILAGDEETGISIMLMEAGLDTGPALSKSALPIHPEDTTLTLTDKLAGLGADLLIETLPNWLNGEITPIVQREGEATYASRILKEDGRINWAASAESIERSIRAYQPWPSAFTTWQEKRLKITIAQATPDLLQGTPGEVVLCPVDDEKSRLAVVTGSGTLWPQVVQLAGKRAMTTDEFIRGATTFVGSVLG
jgi:methionyl-tRNA formyltransferase